MFKFKETVLLLCLILSGAFCYAGGEAKTEIENKKDGTPISVIERATYGGSEKGNAIVPTIITNGTHSLVLILKK